MKMKYSLKKKIVDANITHKYIIQKQKKERERERERETHRESEEIRKKN
jgi:hypothetical protein